MSAARLQKRCAVAAAVLAGVKIAVVARELRVSRSWASRETHALGTGQLLRDFIAAHPEQMQRLLARSVDAVSRALRAEKVSRRKGQIVNRRPDYRVRLQAAKTTLQLLKRYAVFDVRVEQMDRLLHEAWHAIMDAFVAEKVVWRKGLVINLGPDHRVRLDAVEVAIQLFEKLHPHHWAILNRGPRPNASEVHVPVPIAPARRRIHSCSHGGG